MNFCGIDVSAQELVVKVRGPEREEAVRRFANTPSGHKALVGYLLGRRGEAIRAVWKPVAITVWTWPWCWRGRRKSSWK